MGLMLAERYRVDLPGLQAVCEANYARLQRLLPDMRGQTRLRRIALGTLPQAQILCLHVSACGPYTSVVEVREEGGAAWLPQPVLQVRVYHDARMAEVVSAAHCRYLQPRYAYPNPSMHQPDEKLQLNLFLGEWLTHSLRSGCPLDEPLHWSPLSHEH